MSAALPEDGGSDPSRSSGSGTGAGQPPAAVNFAIYAITDRASGREYVGVTARSVEARFRGHRQNALRRKIARPGSLGDAILASDTAGIPFADAFSFRVLDRTDDPDKARRLETHWIEQLGTAAPNGLNLMPGGSSLGGALNSIPVTVEDPDWGTLEYTSLYRAIQVTNQRRSWVGDAPLDAGLVYARLELGWTIEEALELVAHVDGRGTRAPVLWQGRSYDRLREISQLSGIPVATLRSRAHRAGIAGARSRHDLHRDRRSDGTRRRRSPEPLRLPSPDGGGTLSLAAYASRAGIAKSSVLHRYHALVRSGLDPATMPPSEVHAALTGRQDRRIPLELEIAPGIVWRGGVRELIRRLFADWVLECRRPDRVSQSTIRARLRRLPGWPTDMRPVDLRWAFGFEAQRPTNHGR